MMWKALWVLERKSLQDKRTENLDYSKTLQGDGEAGHVHAIYDSEILCLSYTPEQESENYGMQASSCLPYVYVVFWDRAKHICLHIVYGYVLFIAAEFSLTWKV